MRNVRLYFSKTFDARYISHLDLARCFTRAVKKSGVHVWYTEGFNPHIFMTFALPLSLGFESICEIVDIRLLDDTIDSYICEKLNESLPYGIEVYDVREPKQNVSEIAFSRYMIELHDAQMTGDDLKQQTRMLLEQDEITTQKKTKKGVMKEIDLKPLVHEYQLEVKNDMCYLNVVAAAGGEQSLNPMLLLDLLFQRIGKTPDHVLVKRIQILNKELKNFE